MLRNQDGLKVLIPEGLPSDILSLTTTKSSGASLGAYESFNMGFHVGDDKATVLQNYTKLKESLRIDNIQLFNQTHSNIVLEIDKVSSDAPEADGVYTRQAYLATGIMTADCFNVQIIGETSLANLHCGWKSIFHGIVNNAIDLFERDNDKIRCAIVGAGICRDCYMVDQNLADSFQRLIPQKEIFKYLNNMYFLDLREILVQLLTIRGINQILHLNNCSLCNSYLYSYRRDKGITGRMLSVLMRK